MQNAGWNIVRNKGKWDGVISRETFVCRTETSEFEVSLSLNPGLAVYLGDFSQFLIQKMDSRAYLSELLNK